MEVADEDEDLFNQQYNNFKSIINELDVNARHQFWICLDHNRAEVKRKKMRRMNEEQQPREGRKLYARSFEGKYHFLAFARDSIDYPTLNGDHVQYAPQRRKEFWIYQSQQVRAHQTPGFKTTPSSLN